MPRATPETETDRQSWRNLLAIAVEAAGGQSALADILRDDKSTINRWLSGARALGWPDLRAALRRVAARRPAAVPEMVAALAAELLDARGRWVPEDAETVGDYRDEQGDVTVALGALTAAVRRGADDHELAPLRAELIKQAEQAARAAVGVA